MKNNMMKKNGFTTLPNDIKKYIIRKICVRLLIWALLSIFISLFFLAGHKMFGSQNLGSRIIVYVLCMIFLCIFTGVPLKLIDSSWVGEIVKIGTKEGLLFTKEAKPRAYGVVYIMLTIKKANGRVVKKKIQSKTFPLGANHMYIKPQGDVQKSLDMYSVSDRVFHLYGSKFIIVLPNEDAQNIACAVCGTSNSYNSKICEKCGHTLIRQ